MCSLLSDRQDIVPYLPLLLPELQAVLTDPIPEVRSTYLPCISAVSPLYLRCISPVSPLYLRCISAVSPLYLRYICTRCAPTSVPGGWLATTPTLEPQP
jgi:hypothetical protein